MTIKLSKAEVIVLNSLSDDYESLTTAVLGSETDLEAEGALGQVETIMRRLVGLGLARPLRYDVQTTTFVFCSFDSGVAASDMWFEITPDGEQARDENWNEEWGS